MHAFLSDYPLNWDLGSIWKYLTTLKFQGLAWVSTKFTNRSLDHPDIEFHFVSGSPASDGGRQIRKVSIMGWMLTSSCLLELLTVSASHVFRSSSLIKYKMTLLRSVFGVLSQVILDFPWPHQILPPGTLYTFPEELDSSAAPYHDITQHIWDEWHRDSMH